MKVFKFGGASIKDAPSIKNILEIISKYEKDTLLWISTEGFVTIDLSQNNSLRRVFTKEFLTMDHHRRILYYGSPQKFLYHGSSQEDALVWMLTEQFCTRTPKLKHLMTISQFATLEPKV